MKKVRNGIFLQEIYVIEVLTNFFILRKPNESILSKAEANKKGGILFYISKEKLINF